MRFSETAGAVDEEGVVFGADIFRDGEGCRLCEVVGLADDEILEGIGGIEVEGAVGGDDGAVLLLVLRVRSGVGIIVCFGIGVFCIGRVVFAIRFLCIRVQPDPGRAPADRRRTG